MTGQPIGIIGLGRFGRLLAEILRQDFPLKVFDEKQETQQSFAEAAPLHEVASCATIFFCVPLSRLETALLQALPHLTENAFVLDVCSIKLPAVQILESHLPAGVGVLPTHPMFGPDAAAKGLKDRPFVLCKTERTPMERYRALSKYLTERDFKVVEMSPDEHDRTTAYSLCLTQLIGRSLDRVGVRESPSDTQAFRNLLEIRDMACNDSKQLFQDIQMLNPYAGEMRRRWMAALTEIDRELS